MDNFAQRPMEEELRLFTEKIGRRLKERPLDLDPTSHRERVAGLLRQAGEATFYQLLNIPPTATVQEIHEAYDQVARLVHPANAQRLRLDGREGVLEMLFERLTQAYLTLSNLERRKEYDRDLHPDAWSSATDSAPGRRAEVARQYYQRALGLAAADEYHVAIELVQQAVRADARPEYYALLGKLQAKNSNPRWLRSAAENLERALELGSRDAELRVLLGQVLQRLQDGEPEESSSLVSGQARALKGGAPEVEVVDPHGDEIDLPLPDLWKRFRK